MSAASDPEQQRKVREQVARALDDDGFVLGLPGALQAVAEHARLRAVDEEAFVALARAAYQAVAMEHAPEGGVDLCVVTEGRVPVPAQHVEVLDARLAEYEADPDAGRPWEHAEADLRKRLGTVDKSG